MWVIRLRRGGGYGGCWGGVGYGYRDGFWGWRGNGNGIGGVVGWLAVILVFGAGRS